MAKIKDAQFKRNIIFNDKEVAKEKEEKAIEEEKSNQQNKAMKIFNEIDTNKNNKYNYFNTKSLNYNMLIENS